MKSEQTPVTDYTSAEFQLSNPVIFHYPDKTIPAEKRAPRIKYTHPSNRITISTDNRRKSIASLQPEIQWE